MKAKARDPRLRITKSSPFNIKNQRVQHSHIKRPKNNDLEPIRLVKSAAVVHRQGKTHVSHQTLQF